MKIPRIGQIPVGLWFAGALMLLCIVIAGSGADLWLRYDRAAIFAGQAWRLVTGSLVHLGAVHLGVNMLGLALIAILFARTLQIFEWLMATLAALAAVGFGLLAFAPGIALYVGLSGALHGMFAAGAILARGLPPWLRALYLAGLVAKLVWEQLIGALSVSAGLIGANVAVEAHLYGAIGGAAAAGLILAARAIRLRCACAGTSAG